MTGNIFQVKVVAFVFDQRRQPKLEYCIYGMSPREMNNFMVRISASNSRGPMCVEYLFRRLQTAFQRCKSTTGYLDASNPNVYNNFFGIMKDLKVTLRCHVDNTLQRSSDTLLGRYRVCFDFVYRSCPALPRMLYAWIPRMSI